ncbi:MAG: hemerythrin domain-containing protein [Myxococcales bacterium]
MDPFKLMSAEHDTIKCVVSAWETMGRRARAEGEIEVDRVDEFLRFFHHFVEIIHHGKEEQVLFEQLQRAGLDGPVSSIDQLRREHECLSDVLKTIQALSRLLADERANRDQFLRHADEYALWMRNHIRFEDSHLFGVAELLLGEAGREQLAEGFSRYDSPLGAERIELIELGRRLCERYSAPAPTWPVTSADNQPLSSSAGSSRPLRIAIVGAGPAGFFAAAALLNQTDISIEVDVLDRLPSPYGLVRSGVAPDHENIKTVTRVFDRLAMRPGFSYFGNVELGRDVAVSELLRLYDDVIYATGSELDRRLGIPGDGAIGVTPSSVFVGWYNAHPDYREAAPFSFQVEQVAVVGNGNVALDVTRMLVRTTAELRQTDIAEHALGLLERSALKRVYILGRRTIYESAFSPHELRDLVQLEGVRCVVDGRELDPACIGDPLAVSAASRANWETLRNAQERRTAEARVEVVFRFLVSPETVLTDEASHVRALRLALLERSADADGRVEFRDSGAREEIAVDWIYTAIGYRAKPLPGVPYDPVRGIIPNQAGRVVNLASGKVREHEYCVGWAQSGPRGVIGTHKRTSAAVVSELLRDEAALGSLERADRTGGPGLASLLLQRGVKPVGFGAWQRIDSVEVERGAARGAPRSKLADIDQMLAAAGLQKES